MTTQEILTAQGDAEDRIIRACNGLVAILNTNKDTRKMFADAVRYIDNDPGISAEDAEFELREAVDALKSYNDLHNALLESLKKGPQ